jgi:hypothetical protein
MMELELLPVACGGVVVWWLGAVLRWWEPKADGGGASTTPQIKLSYLFLDPNGAGSFSSWSPWWWKRREDPHR